MRITLNIDETLVNQLLEATHEKSKTRAVTIAVSDYLKKKNLRKILSYQGNLNIETDWEQLEKEGIDIL